MPSWPQSKAIGPEDFNELTKRLRETEPGLRLPLVDTATQMNFFTSEQGRVLVSLLDNSFDKVSDTHKSYRLARSVLARHCMGRRVASLTS